MIVQILQHIQEKIPDFFYETLKQEIPIQVGSVARSTPVNFQISIHDSTSLLAQESVSKDTIVPIPNKPIKIKAYNKKTDTGTIRVSTHIRKPSRPTLKQRFKVLKAAISKDNAPLKRPEIDIHEVVRKALIGSFQRLSN